MVRMLIAAAAAAALASAGCTRLLVGQRESRPNEEATASHSEETSAAVSPPEEVEGSSARSERPAQQDKAAGTRRRDCSTLDQRFASVPEDPVRGCGWSCPEAEARRIDAAVHDLARQYAACKQYAGLFERVAARYAGPAALEALETNGVPVEQAFVAYMQSHRGPAFLRTDDPAAAMWGVTQWLVKKRHMSHCPELAAALDGASADAHGGAVFYFYKTRCKQALPRVVVALGSKSHRYRGAACEVLGDIGDAAVLPRLHHLATRDPFSYGLTSAADLAREEAAWDAVDVDSDEDEDEDAILNAIETEQNSRANEKAHYPVRQACAEAHRALSKRVKPPARGRKSAASQARGRR
jgi:hypothetical protein